MPNYPAAASGHFHAVRFYSESESLAGVAAEFITEGLTLAQPAIVIATPLHRLLIARKLSTGGLDVPRLEARNNLLLLDANETLSAFMVGGVPHGARLRAILGPVMERICRGRDGCRVRAFGEMVNVLWQRGNAAAALRLESMWNALAHEHDMAILCGYAMAAFERSATQQGEICRHHTHVVSASGELATVN